MGRLRKRWALSVGGYGHTVTVCERMRGGSLYLRYWDPTRPNGGNWTWRSLRHQDRVRAEAQARELAGVLLAAIIVARAHGVTWAELSARYEREVSRHKQGAQPREDRRRIAIWTTFLGATRDMSRLDFPTLGRFTRERRAGALRVPSTRPDARPGELLKITRAPSDTTIGADLVFLQSVLNWATRVVLPDGSRLLAINPVRGYVSPRNKNVKRPIASYDRFLAIRAHADAVDPQHLFGSLLDLLEALGWRVTAVCELRASDVDLRAKDNAPHGRLLKRAAVDKEGVEMWVPLSPSARAAIDRILSVNPTLGDMPLFPAPRARDGTRPAPWQRYHARAMLERAEVAAGLTPMDGGDFHPYRRAWATARKHLPARDVAAAGGWRDLRTLEQCYTLVDESTLLAVVTEPRKLREVKTS